MHLEKELGVARYEKTQIEKAFENLRRQVETRVPRIASVEGRRIELESILIEKDREGRNMQEQLREAIKKNAKLIQERGELEKRAKDAESETKTLR